MSVPRGFIFEGNLSRRGGVIAVGKPLAGDDDVCCDLEPELPRYLHFASGPLLHPNIFGISTGTITDRVCNTRNCSIDSSHNHWHPQLTQRHCSLPPPLIMQSGIKASQELKDAFNSLVSSSSSFAVVVTIESETLQPVTTIPSSSGFPSDLSAVQAELSPNVARYVLVRRSDAPDGFVGITYVPDSAPVRQKMLFASTRLTLIRELGLERFGETIFCTTKEEVSEEGWKKHEKHRQMDNPLTEEERANQELRDAESLEQGGTMRRHGHYTDDNGSAGQSGMATPTTSAAGKLAMKTGQGVLEALKGLQSAGAGALVQIVSP